MRVHAHSPKSDRGSEMDVFEIVKILYTAKNWFQNAFRSYNFWLNRRTVARDQIFARLKRLFVWFFFFQAFRDAFELSKEDEKMAGLLEELKTVVGLRGKNIKEALRTIYEDKTSVLSKLVDSDGTLSDMVRDGAEEHGKWRCFNRETLILHFFFPLESTSSTSAETSSREKAWTSILCTHGTKRNKGVVWIGIFALRKKRLCPIHGGCAGLWILQPGFESSCCPALFCLYP